MRTMDADLSSSNQIIRCRHQSYFRKGNPHRVCEAHQLSWFFIAMWKGRCKMFTRIKILDQSYRSRHILDASFAKAIETLLINTDDIASHKISQSLRRSARLVDWSHHPHPNMIIARCKNTQSHDLVTVAVYKELLTKWIHPGLVSGRITHPMKSVRALLNV